MLRRDVVSRGSSCAAFENAWNASASSPPASATSPVARCAIALLRVRRRAPASRGAAPCRARPSRGDRARARRAPSRRRAFARAPRAPARSPCRAAPSRAARRRAACARRSRCGCSFTKSSSPSAASLFAPRRRRTSRERDGDLLALGRDLRGGCEAAPRRSRDRPPLASTTPRSKRASHRFGSIAIASRRSAIARVALPRILRRAARLAPSFARRSGFAGGSPVGGLRPVAALV